MISEERLKEAARRCEEHMLNCLPDPSECKATFSPRFEQKMKRLFFKINQPLLFWISGIIASLLLILLLAVCGVFVFNVAVRASVFG